MNGITHPNLEQIERFRNGRMDVAELLAVDDHLAACAGCRSRFSPVTWQQAAEVSGQLGIVHLTRDDLLGLAAGQPLPEASLHLDSCPACRREFDDLERSLPRMGRTASAARKQSWRPLTAAALLLIGIGILYLAFLRRPPVAEFAEHDGAVPEDYRAAVDQIWRSSALEIPKVLAELRPPSGRLMGGSSAPVATDFWGAFEPLGVVVASTAPVFRWQAIANAAAYSVSVYDTDFHKVAESPRLTVNQWKASSNLGRGQLYQWQLTAFLTSGATLRVPEPPLPEARFRVIDEAENRRLAELRSRYPDSHLLLGVKYFNAGLVTEAREQFQLLAAANPNSSEARRLAFETQQLLGNAANQAPSPNKR